MRTDRPETAGGGTRGASGAGRMSKSKAQQKYKSAETRDAKATNDVMRNRLNVRNSPTDAGTKKRLADSVKVMEKTAKAKNAAKIPSSKMKPANKKGK